MEAVIVEDIVANPTSLARDLFEQELELIKQQHFPLQYNYTNIDLAKYFAFHVVVYENKLVAFAGMQYDSNKFPPNMPRMMTRMYIAEGFRRKGLCVAKKEHTPGPIDLPILRYVFPIQVATAKKMGFDGVFISREYPEQIKSIRSRLNHINNISVVDDNKFKLYDYICNVCGKDSNDISCWQCILYMLFNSNVTPDIFKDTFATMTLEQWKTTFNYK